MKHREITLDRFRLPPSHPILAQVDIEPADWFQFERLDADNPTTHIVGHDILDGRLIVFVACSSDKVRQRLEDGLEFEITVSDRAEVGYDP
jgi:hypothetical protein